MMHWRTQGTAGTVDVYHDSDMEGGGTWFGQEYLTEIAARFPARRFRRCYEWCSGPGFIGFALLAHGVCDSLCLSDCYEPAIKQAIPLTQAHNPWCRDRVSAYLGSTLSCLPSNEQFDLVVSNPPHFQCEGGTATDRRLRLDAGWAAHRDFYQNISKHLADDGVIMMQENQAGSTNGASEFWNMIHSNGLELTGYWTSPGFWNSMGPTQIYYLEIKKLRQISRRD